MSLEDSIKENTAAIKELSLIMANIKGTPAAAEDPANTDKPKTAKTSKPAAEKQSDPKPETSASTAEDPAGPTDPDTSDDVGADAPELDYQKDVVPAVTAVAKKLQREGALKVLAKFDVDSASKLDKSRWPELIEACKKAIEE